MLIFICFAGFISPRRRKRPADPQQCEVQVRETDNNLHRIVLILSVIVDTLTSIFARSQRGIEIDQHLCSGRVVGGGNGVTCNAQRAFGG